MFCQFNGKVVNTNAIKYIDCNLFLGYGQVNVFYVGSSEIEPVNGAEALQLIMDFCPRVLEGKRGRYLKSQWAVHNLIGHPLMQILSWLYLRRWAMWIHEATIPRPQMPIKRQ